AFDDYGLAVSSPMTVSALDHHRLAVSSMMAIIALDHDRFSVPSVMTAVTEIDTKRYGTAEKPVASVPVVAAPRAVVVPPERNQPGAVVVVMVAAPHAHVARLIVMMAPRRTVMAVVKADCKATAMAAG
ncbi:MAG: hypothetical protein IID42_14005, partial [Planctomycetes bacterium]|nr:hypothetical protein [Planctomycetota bacterium]